MNEVFNSELELSLRILLTLYTAPRSLNADEIVLSDFITIYSHEFGLSEENLHGTNEFSFAEFATRREQFHGALKYLVVNGYVLVLPTKDGFMYQDSTIGESVCDSMTTEYADAYMDYSYKAHDYMQSKTITELFSYINKMAMLRKEEAQ